MIDNALASRPITSRMKPSMPPLWSISSNTGSSCAAASGILAKTTLLSRKSATIRSRSTPSIDRSIAAPTPVRVASGGTMEEQRIHVALGGQPEEELPVAAEVGHESQVLAAGFGGDARVALVVELGVAHRDVFPS